MAIKKNMNVGANIASALKVGIGTLSPHKQLHVKGNGEIFNLEGDDHTFMSFYPSKLTGGSKAIFGFIEANEVQDLTIKNTHTNKTIVLDNNATIKNSAVIQGTTESSGDSTGLIII